MEAKKCDRCGKLYEYTPVTTLFEKYDANDSVILRRCDIDGNERNALEWDLCPECKAAFDSWIMAGCIVGTAPEEEVETQRVKVGEYWQNNATGAIVKVTDADEIEVHFKRVASGEYFREETNDFKKTHTKKGGAE